MFIAMTLCNIHRMYVQVKLLHVHVRSYTSLRRNNWVTTVTQSTTYSYNAFFSWTWAHTRRQWARMLEREDRHSLPTHKTCRVDPCMSCWCPILPLYCSTPMSSSRRVAWKVIKGHARAFTVVIGAPNCTTALNHCSIVYYLQTTSVLTLYLLTTSMRALHSAAVFATQA